MKLFTSNSKKSDIFIPIGEGCPTNCQSCSHALRKTKSYTLGHIQKQIELSNNLSDKSFSYFLYGVRKHDVLELKKISHYIYSLGRKIRLQIDIDTSSDHLIIIQRETKINEYVISKKIATVRDFKNLIQSIQVFSGKNNYVIQYDLLLDNKFSPLLEKVIGKLMKDEYGFFEKRLGNLFFHIQPLYSINYKNKSIDGISFYSCIIKPLFDTGTDQIIIHDHYEINSDLDIMFHNPLCFLGNNRVSNLKLETKEIVRHFGEYKKHLESLDHDLEKNCFKCISSGFDYNDIPK